ncbi:MAG: ACP S-malonyltransferase [Gammaproteobacteria bacterium]|nr:ACP S-malonyltransferase [Gammaproteobacteria bacterium]
MALAFVFPGQGSQSLGMLSELAGQQPIVEQTFAEASAVLGYDLWQLCQEGPEERLNATECTQPALLTASVATWRIWCERTDVRPEYTAGHSLGEYSALVCAGALDFPAAIELVAFRGRAMQEAVPAGSGAMAAILGLDDAAVKDACDAVKGQDVLSPVNFNAPGQVVIAGHAEAVDRAIEEVKAKGAKRALKLPVSVPSHCDLMKPAADRMAEKLSEVQISAPVTPVVHNVDVAEHLDAAAIRRALVAQLHNPVRWVETIHYLAKQGITAMVECGPGKVLAGLNKRIARDINTLPLFDSGTLTKALEAIGE